MANSSTSSQSLSIAQMMSAGPCSKGSNNSSYVGEKQQEILGKKLIALEQDLRNAQSQCCQLQLDKAELRRQLLPHASADHKRNAANERIRDELDAEKRRADAAIAKLDEQKRSADAVIAKWQDSEKEWIALHLHLQQALQASEARRDEEITMFKANFEAQRLASHQQTERELENVMATNDILLSRLERSKSDALAKEQDVEHLHAECERLRYRTDAHLAQNEELRRRERVLNEQVAALEKHLEERNAALTGARSTASEMRLALDEKATQLSAMTQQWQCKTDDADSLAAQLAVVTTKLERLTHAHQHDITEMLTTERHLKQDAATLQSKLGDAESSRRADAAKHSAQVASLEGQVDALRIEVAQLKTLLSASADASALSQRQADERQQLLSEVQSMLSCKDAELVDVHAKLKTAQHSLEAAVIYTADLEATLQTHVTAEQHHQATLSVHQQRLGELQTAVCAMAVDKVNLLQAWDAKHVAMDEGLHRAHIEVEEGAAHTAVLVQRFAAREALILAQQRCAAHAEQASAHAQLTDMAAKCQVFTEERDALRTKFNAERDAVVVLKRKLANEERGHAAAVAHAHHHEAELLSLQSQLQGKLREVEVIKARKDECKAAFVRLREAFIPLREHDERMKKAYDDLVKGHKHLVRDANRQYRRLRDAAGQSKGLLEMIMSSLDGLLPPSVPQAHYATRQHPIATRDAIAECIAVIDAALLGCKDAIDPVGGLHDDALPAHGAVLRVGLSNGPPLNTLEETSLRQKKRPRDAVHVLGVSAEHYKQPE